MCYDAKDFEALNDNILMLAKRRGALKMVRLIAFKSPLVWTASPP